jgi:glycosyltransferase involved in cell wall biosynthesis
MSMPNVTIGLPVYNGAAFIATAIDSLLAQTYGAFELSISV